MNPQNIFTRLAHHLGKQPLKKYTIFVALADIKSEPPGRNVLIRFVRTHRERMVLVATDASPHEMLLWSDWHTRISSMDYTQNPPEVYWNDHPDATYQVRDQRIKNAQPGSPGVSKNIDSDYVCELQQQGYKIIDIARKLDISPAAVNYHIKKNN